MARLVFETGRQKAFFNEVRVSLDIGYDEIARKIDISGRSLRDWVYEKILGNKEKLVKLSELSGVSLPEILEEREEWWSGRVHGRKAALIRLKKYGIPGSIETRRKGGLISQINRRNNPEYYRSLGCNVANKFQKPNKSVKLAEWVGVVLGDGGLTRDQCQISLDLKSDREYAKTVAKLVERLFGFPPSVLEYYKSSLIRIVITGVDFVKMMNLFGMETGNKIAHQVSIPKWIKDNNLYYRACIRGLFDTDGGSFTHRHWVKSYKYRHFGLTFTSASKPLLQDFSNYLKIEDIKHAIGGVNIFIRDLHHVRKFFDIVKPSNTKHFKRLQLHLSSPTRLN